MQVLMAEAMGFCFGVRDALEIVERVAEPASVTIHGQLVHNQQVVSRLESRGFRTTREDDRGELPPTPAVLITAHGLSDSHRSRLEEAGKQIIDTTCPLVRKAHRAAQMLANDDRHVIVIGSPGHVEVLGIVEDLPSYDVVSNASQARAFGHSRLGILCQTTTAPRVAQEVLDAIRSANPHSDIRYVDTICQPTRDRQWAVERLVARVKVVVVVGGKNSNNTLELVALCRRRGAVAYHIQSTAQIDAAWFTGCQQVGLTAGTSTPDFLIREVHEALLRL